jgi:nucleoid-associated protein YgaU
MPRPRSFYERGTRSTLTPPERRERSHTVVQGETLVVVATVEYSLQEYRPELWRLIAEKNAVQDPFRFSMDLTGQSVRIPAEPLPDFL